MSPFCCFLCLTAAKKYQHNTSWCVECISEIMRAGLLPPPTYFWTSQNFGWTYFMIAQILFKFLTSCEGDDEQYWGWRKLVWNNEAQRSDDTMKTDTMEKNGGKKVRHVFWRWDRWLVCKKRQ